MSQNEIQPTVDCVKKTNTIQQVRYGCAIGAFQSVVAIPRVIPIAHCGPGCVDKQSSNLALTNGHQGSGYGGGATMPSLNASEKEVVFGGTDKLHSLIEASLKILDADLFVVTTGCISDIVGDDVASVVKEFQKKDVPIVYAETGGFKGTNFYGHEVITKAIIDQFVGDYEGPKEKGTINVWSLLPYHNTFWRGDFIEIKRILVGAGFKVNILFGKGSAGVSEWRNIPKAQFNLVISPWLGLQTAEHLKEKYNQPYLQIPAIPIGAKETREFIRKVVNFSGINNEKSEIFIKSEEELYYSFLEDFSDFYAEYWWGLPSTFAVVSDSAYSLSLTRFLVNQLGLAPQKVIITDNPPEEYRESIRKQFRNIAPDVSVEVDFEEDSYIIHEKLKLGNLGNKPPIIFGTTWERDIAKELNGSIVEVSFPASYEVVVSRTYVGYQGALSLIEKIYTTALSGTA